VSEGVYSTTVAINDHRVEPGGIYVTAGKRVILAVINADPLWDDSPALKVEKGDIWQISGPGALWSTRSQSLPRINCSGPVPASRSNTHV
jgi:hypothetical protein